MKTAGPTMRFMYYDEMLFTKSIYLFSGITSNMWTNELSPYGRMTDTYISLKCYQSTYIVCPYTGP